MKRFEWLASMINSRAYVRSVELGVRDGVTSRYLMENCPELRYHLMVDLWQAQPDNSGPETYEGMNHGMNLAAVERVEADHQDRCYIVRKHTVAAAETFPRESVDIVFVDADHGYQAVKSDIAAWITKVRSGGVLCGHDYDWPTVKKAVDECFTGSLFDVLQGGERGTNIWWVEVP